MRLVVKELRPGAVLARCLASRILRFAMGYSTLSVSRAERKGREWVTDIDEVAWQLWKLQSGSKVEARAEIQTRSFQV